MTTTLTTWKRRRKSQRPRWQPGTVRLLLLLALSLSALSFVPSPQPIPSHPSIASCSSLVVAASAAEPPPARPVGGQWPARQAGQRKSVASNESIAQATSTETTTTTATSTLATITQATTVKQKPQDARRRQKVKSSDAQARTRSQQQQPPVQTQKQPVTANKNGQKSSGSNLWRPTKSFRLQQEPAEANQGVQDQQQQQTATSSSPADLFQGSGGGGGGLQVSITPRVSHVRVPVESNTILKCLISAQLDNFTRPFKVRWSRFMYDENVYEQIESSPGFDMEPTKWDELGASKLRLKRDTSDDEQAQFPSGPAPSSSLASDNNNNNNGASDSDNQPAPPVLDRQQQLRDFLARSRQETNVISNILIEATLSISPVKASDNATYYCTATDGLGGLAESQNQAHIDLVALHQPVLRLDRVWPARDSKSALVYWSIISDGNTPIKRTILMVRNDSQSLIEARRNSQRYAQPEAASEQQHSTSMVFDNNERNQWHRIEIAGDGSDQSETSQYPGGLQPIQPALPEDNVVRAFDMDVTSIGGDSSSSYSNPTSSQAQDRWRPRLKRKQRAFNLTSLLPGVTYQLRLAAINDMGQSNWTQLQATMPNEIPAQISDIVVLSTTNDSMTIGWRRPPYDGAKTIRYELQLFDLNRTLTLDANTNTNSTGALRTNFMFHFVNLNPGTDYHFHIRACSPAGCSAYSSPKLLVSTLDGEPDEPLDVELVCQWAGSISTNNYKQSSLQTASSSLDSNNQQAQQSTMPPPSSQLSVSWLPPVNVRGKLLNYSVIIQSSARYLNQSGQWARDEWRTTIETGDNHTLSLEASNLLAPNTNYTARVCANNRSKKCGRLSQLTQRSQCSTPVELPSELPENIQLGLKQVKPLTDVDQDRQSQVETLVLDLPFISLRNGSIDCIQIVLVRLPPSFDNSQRALSDLLPDDPAELKLQEYFELLDDNREDGGAERSLTTANTNPAGGAPLAYLAEELSATNQSGSLEELSQGAKQILLGDGTQKNCNAIWARLQSQSNSKAQNEEQQQQRPAAFAQDGTERISGGQQRRPQTQTSRPVRAIDGPLLAQTYYTGFLKLVQLRPASVKPGGAHSNTFATVTSNGEARTRRQPLEGTDFELATKFSNYFSPIKTGEHVPEVSISSLRAGNELNANEDDPDSLLDEPSKHLASNNSICVHKLVVLLQEKLGTNRTCLVVTGFVETIRRNAVHLFRVSTNYFNERLKLMPVGEGQRTSVVTMQPLEIGLMVIGSTLLVMFVIYLLLLPARLTRKRKLKMKRKLQQHENAILQQQQQATGLGPISSPLHHLEDQSGGFMPVVDKPQQQDQLELNNGHQQQHQSMLVHSKSRQQLDPQFQQQQQHHSPLSHQQQQQQSFGTNMGYQQVATVHQQSPQHQHHHHAAVAPVAPNGAATLGRYNQECPVHSSPMSQLNDHPSVANSSHSHHLLHQDQDKCNGANEQEGPFHATMHKDRRQSVHVCQPANSMQQQQQQQQVVYGHQTEQRLNGGHHHHHHPHHHHQHHQSAYQLNGGSGLEFDDDQQQHVRHGASIGMDRNCRTMTRRQMVSTADDSDYGLDRANNALPADYGYKTLHHHHHHQHQHNQAYAMAHNHHHHQHHRNQQPQAIASVEYAAGGMAATMRPGTSWNQTLARQQSTVLAMAKKINKSIPLNLFQAVMETRLKNNWLREEYEQLPRLAQQQQQPAGVGNSGGPNQDDGRHLKLRPQLIVSRDDSVSALIIGNHQYDASLVKLQVPVAGANSGPSGMALVEKQFICAKSPVDPNTVWDFWRLIYEKEVNTLVMLTPNEDVHTGELRCAQYWPTCDNEVTTILSPRNDSVAQSKWPLAKFKICQETLSGPEMAGSGGGDSTGDVEFVIRRLTLLVMATKPSENEHLNAAPSGATTTTAATPTATNDEQQPAETNNQTEGQPAGSNGNGNGQGPKELANNRRSSGASDQLPAPPPLPPPEPLPNSNEGGNDDGNNNNNDQDDEVIVERNLLHFQFLHWNASSSSNQMKLIKFIELVNEQHAQLMQQQASPGANWQQISPQNPILVHCANGIGRSGLFTAMSFVIDDLSYKLAALNASVLSRAGGGQQQQQVVAKLNLFQLVSRLRNHRDMLLSPYRFYELLYQLTAKCIPAHISNQDQQQQQQQQLKSRFIQ